MKPYIEGNNELRGKAINEFERDFFKLMNNSVFGKTMENVRNRMNLHLTTDHDNAVKWFSKPEFKNNTHAHGLYLIETYKTKIVYDKPVYVGCTVLDLSKLHMLRFHYDLMEPTFGEKAEVVYSDTDSFVYAIEHPNIYEWIGENKTWFDLSKCKREELKCDDNKNCLGKFKDELHGLPMTEMLGLNPKSFAFRCQKECKSIGETKKAKGVPKATVDKDMAFKSYEEVLESGAA